MSVKVVFRHGALQEIRKSAEVRADLDARARRIAAAAGEGFEVSARTGRTRARASVITATYEARRAEADTAALTRAIDAGR